MQKDSRGHKTLERVPTRIRGVAVSSANGARKGKCQSVDIDMSGSAHTLDHGFTLTVIDAPPLSKQSKASRGR